MCSAQRLGSLHGGEEVFSKSVINIGAGTSVVALMWEVSRSSWAQTFHEMTSGLMTSYGKKAACLCWVCYSVG